MTCGFRCSRVPPGTACALAWMRLLVLMAIPQIMQAQTDDFFFEGSLNMSSTEKDFVWVSISDGAACEGADGLKLLGQMPHVGLSACQDTCLGFPGCAAVDYYRDKEWCQMYDTACTNPSQESKGASSWRMERVTTTSGSVTIAKPEPAEPAEPAEQKLELSPEAQKHLQLGCQGAAILVLLFTFARSRAAEQQAIPYRAIEASDQSQAGQLEALNVIRFVAIVHITFLHMGPIATAGFNQWGGAWLGFFFALSGLGPAYSKLNKPHVDTDLPEPSMCSWSWLSGALVQFRKRWLSVYPLYFLALVIAVAAYKLSYVDTRPHWVVFMEAAMLQSYGPSNTHIAMCYNIPDWFVSSLVLCWVLEEFLFELAKACWRRGTLGVVLAWCGAFAWKGLTTLAVSHFQLPYGNENGLPDVHCYFCGILLAFLISGQSNAAIYVSSTAASVAALALGLLTTYVQDPLFVNTQSRTGMFPMQCLLMYGLGMGRDPLANLLTRLPPYTYGFSYAMYILQWPLKGACPWWRPLPQMQSITQMLTFLFILIVVSAAAQQFVQKPSERFVKDRCSSKS